MRWTAVPRGDAGEYGGGAWTMADWTRRVPGGDDKMLDQETAINYVEGWASKGMVTGRTLLLVNLRGSRGF